MELKSIVQPQAFYGFLGSAPGIGPGELLIIMTIDVNMQWEKPLGLHR